MPDRSALARESRSFYPCNGTPTGACARPQHGGSASYSFAAASTGESEKRVDPRAISAYVPGVQLRSLPLEALTIDDERSLRHIALYGELKQVLLRDGVRFLVAPAGSPQAFWDRVLFLNQT